MPSLRIRWSEQEARKPYARPFMVTFTADDGTDVGSVALNGADLLYYTQFQTAVLSLAGELFVDTAVEASGDSQRAWLDRIAGLIPKIGVIGITPRSTFDDNQGRVFRLVINADGGLPFDNRVFTLERGNSPLTILQSGRSRMLADRDPGAGRVNQADGFIR